MSPVQARLNIDTTGFVIYEYPASRHDNGVIEQDAGRAAVLAQYTLMAKKPVTIPTTMTADAGNTGTGTVTAVAAALGGVPIVGTWELENVLAVAEGGIFKLTDPNGNIVDSNIVLTVGAGSVTVFTAGGLTFTITEGGTDFALADLFTLAVTANGKTVPFDPAAVDGSEIPDSIYMGEDITAAALVAGDVVDVPLVYEGMKFDEDKLVFDDGTTTLDTLLATGKTIRETLALVTLIPQKTDTASAFENA
jgi:hypothetical protein